MSANKDNYSSDELMAPEWMNKEFFKDVLDKHLKDSSVSITEFKISPATAKGDHYASIMFRSAVEYSLGKDKFHMSLIIKTMPEVNGDKKEFLGDARIFPTEIAMYTEVLPQFEAILSDAGDRTTLCARCIYHSLEPRQVMVFEDLVPQGYKVIRNRMGTELEIKSALSKLAKWQAVSYKLLKENPHQFDHLKYDVTTVPNFLEQDMITSAFPNFLDALKKAEKLKEFVKYLEPMKDKILYRWADIIREYRENRQDNSYYVLSHGDFHIKNMMFKGNECMLLDFQMSYVGSIANDVTYAVYLLMGPDDRREHYDVYMYYYFTTFTETLAKIGFKGEMPNLIEFRKQLFDRRDANIFMLTYMPTFNHMRRGVDFGEFLNDAEKRKELFHYKDYLEELEHLLPRMLHLGYFDQLN